MADLVREMAQAIVVRWDETRKVFDECGKEPPNLLGLMFHGREVEKLREALAAPTTGASVPTEGT